VTRCPACKRKFPSHVVTKAFVDGQYKLMCPLCYAEKIRQMTGADWKPKGEIASDMLEEAKELYPGG
jgi:hypothetical protein